MRCIPTLSLALLLPLGCDCRRPESSIPLSTTDALVAVEAATPSPSVTIEGLDQLAELIQQRLALMPDVARFKWNHKKPVTDPEREQQLLNSLVTKATEHGVSEALARRFFAAQMAAARNVQERLTNEWQQANAGSFENIPDLDKDLRPKITELSESMLAPLRLLEPVLNEAPASEYAASVLKQQSDAHPQFADALKLAFEPLLASGAN